jgi:predicted RNA binding protein YcfA (HicA-like mRNA interferase family)
MPHYGAINWRTLVQGLQSLGFDGPYPGGRHQYMVKGELRLTIPNPHTGDISVGLLARILRQAGIDRATWESV